VGTRIPGFENADENALRKDEFGNFPLVYGLFWASTICQALANLVVIVTFFYAIEKDRSKYQLAMFLLLLVTVTLSISGITLAYLSETVTAARDSGCYSSIAPTESLLVFIAGAVLAFIACCSVAIHTVCDCSILQA
jgi:hypothetical protein